MNCDMHHSPSSGKRKKLSKKDDIYLDHPSKSRGNLFELGEATELSLFLDVDDLSAERALWSVFKSKPSTTDSVSSVSLMSPFDALSRPYSKPSIGSRSDIESDGGSRRVALNRKSISPMAPASRAL
ncbi:hypothetical protein BDR03DRAFT_1018923 [Suillus americanus]|nr:hypothetical protein BDR03DRAFT_1018923 [Suillus americanus]